MDTDDIEGPIPTRVELGVIEDFLQDSVSNLVVISIAFGIDSLSIVVDAALTTIVDRPSGPPGSAADWRGRRCLLFR